MPYLLDTNTLIQAKNEYYAFSLCPGFWDWIDLQTTTGEVFSIEPVLREIRDVADELKDWADSRASALFRSIDSEKMIKFPEVVTWVQQGDFKDEAKRDFLAKADPLLIAYAMAHPGTILATHEVHIEGERKKVKIPTVCRALGVSCVRTFGMLSRENARFVLPQ
jgi:hypothetical protein